MQVAAAVLYHGVVCVVWIKSRQTHDTVFDRPTAPMYQPVPDCRIVCRREGGLGGSDRAAQL